VSFAVLVAVSAFIIFWFVRRKGKPTHCRRMGEDPPISANVDTAI
jgi:hypothetical protein